MGQAVIDSYYRKLKTSRHKQSLNHNHSLGCGSVVESLPIMHKSLPSSSRTVKINYAINTTLKQAQRCTYYRKHMNRDWQQRIDTPLYCVFFPSQIWTAIQPNLKQNKQKNIGKKIRTKKPGNSESKQKAVSKIRKSFLNLKYVFQNDEKTPTGGCGFLTFLLLWRDATAKATYWGHSLLRNTVSEGESPWPLWQGAWQQEAIAHTMMNNHRQRELTEK